MGRSPCCLKEGLNKGAWTPLEDKTLADFITTHGEGKWRSLPKRAGLKRCGKSCRLRWLNYLRPDIKRGNITPDEEDLIIRLHKLLGNRWSLIAGRLPGRTDNEIKNYWNTNIGRRIQLPNYKPISPLIQSKKNSSPSSSSVVRSKASRCSKTFINSQQQPQQQLDSTAMAPPKVVEAAAAPPDPASTDDLNPQHQQPTEDDQNFNFHESTADDDFFMKDDDNFLTNLFDTELFMPPPYSPPPRFDYNEIGHNSSTLNAFDTEASSSNPCGVHAYESFDGMFHSTELGSMNMMSIFDTTLCTTNLDWIQE